MTREANKRQAFKVTIWAEGEGENTAQEAVHHALSAACRAGHSIEWGDAVPEGNIDEGTIERVASAIDSADIGHSMTLIRLVDGVSTYRLEIDGSVEEYTDADEETATEQAYLRIRQVRQRKQAEAVIAALANARGLISTTITREIGGQDA